MRIRTAGKGIVGLAAMASATWASVAFACSPMPSVYSVVPESASPGSTVMVKGQNAGSQVEIRWNGAKGDVLATATTEAGVFSVPVRVPDSAPGVYAMTLVTADAGVGRTSFEVTAPANSAVPVPTERLWPSASNASSSSTPSGVSPAGVALLSVGLIGLASGATVAVARRRRAPAR